MSSTSPTDAGPGPRFRASDVERMAVAQVLQDAVARGLLTPDEGSERTGAAFAAVYRDELPALTVDLPPAPGHPGTRRDGGAGPLWAKVRAFLLGLWLILLARVSRWSPRKRVLAAVALGAVILFVGLGLWGLVGEEHGFERDGIEYLHS